MNGSSAARARQRIQTSSKAPRARMHAAAKRREERAQRPIRRARAARTEAALREKSAIERSAQRALQQPLHQLRCGASTVRATQRAPRRAAATMNAGAATSATSTPHLRVVEHRAAEVERAEAAGRPARRGGASARRASAAHSAGGDEPAMTTYSAPRPWRRPPRASGGGTARRVSGRSRARRRRARPVPRRALRVAAGHATADCARRRGVAATRRAAPRRRSCASAAPSARAVCSAAGTCSNPCRKHHRPPPPARARTRRSISLPRSATTVRTGPAPREDADGRGDQWSSRLSLESTPSGEFQVGRGSCDACGIFAETAGLGRKRARACGRGRGVQVGPPARQSGRDRARARAAAERRLPRSRRRGALHADLRGANADDDVSICEVGPPRRRLRTSPMAQLAAGNVRDARDGAVAVRAFVSDPSAQAQANAVTALVRGHGGGVGTWAGSYPRAGGGDQRFWRTRPSPPCAASGTGWRTRRRRRCTPGCSDAAAAARGGRRLVKLPPGAKRLSLGGGGGGAATQAAERYVASALELAAASPAASLELLGGCRRSYSRRRRRSPTAR